MDFQHDRFFFVVFFSLFFFFPFFITVIVSEIQLETNVRGQKSKYMQ